MFAMTKTKPLDPQLVHGEKPTLKEPRVIGDWVVWLEQRPKEKGRTTALIRPWKLVDVNPQELTPFPIDLRTRVHGYGGNPLNISKKGNQLLITWINESDGCLWTQSWLGLLKVNGILPEKLYENGPPLCLSLKSELLFADGLIDEGRDRWVGIMESNGKDFLVAFSLKKESQSPLILYSAKDFLGYLSLSPKGDEIAWIEWEQPFMPWDSSRLHWASLSAQGDILETKTLLPGSLDQEKNRSVFQPTWFSNGQLLVAEDSQGFWNLIVFDPRISLQSISSWKRPWKVDGEIGMPQWVFGMSTHSCVGENVVSIICEHGSWSLALLSKNGSVTTIKQPFNDIEGLFAQDDKKIVAIASNPLTSQGLLELDLQDGSWTHSPAQNNQLKQNEIVVPKAFWFTNNHSQKVHSWFYPPLNGEKTVPVLVKSHSGPTGMARCGLNLEIQFWTSRGWGVLDVNYGGSSGFGREYRERLKMSWGELDVWDCAIGVQKLIDCGIADPKRIAIEGSSAAGFTSLACLCFTDLFSVAACRYAVTDLNSMIHSTHRFESHYLNYLVGELDENSNNYFNRSPINNVEKINCPVILFQGLKDKVVPVNQAKEMKDALLKNNIPVELHVYSDEGHGFRNGLVKVSVLKQTEEFFRKHLDL